jgi:hypothetical protein
VLDAILQAKPRDQYYLFMGFCPNAELANRLDIEWNEYSAQIIQRFRVIVDNAAGSAAIVADSSRVSTMR